MGLMYVFPVSLEEEDFVQNKTESLTLKTYGLPYIFWGYAAASIAVILFMFLAVREPVLKLISLGDETDATLGYSLLSFIGFLPVFILSFFFYEKRIVSKHQVITLEYRLFGLKFFSETFSYEALDPFSVTPFLSSPNVARMAAREESQGFENKGYYVLWITLDSGKKILIDRHSRKADLLKLKTLITGK
jgi:hypothetical protein